MERESYEHGVPSWVDIGTPDPAGAREFYGGLFGWQVEEGPPEAGGYAIALLRGRPVAGLGPQQNPGPPVWTTYVNVDDVDALVPAVDRHGGKVLMPPMDVLDAGRMAIFADPAGAVFGVWQPRGHVGAGVVDEPGAYCWSELITTDVAGAKEFYGGVLGWGAHTHDDDEFGGYTEFQVGDRSVAGMMPKLASMPAEMPPNWLVYFAVADTDTAVARVRELGGSVAAEPRDIEPGRFAVVTDPQGGAFGIIAMSGTT